MIFLLNNGAKLNKIYNKVKFRKIKMMIIKIIIILIMMAFLNKSLLIIIYIRKMLWMKIYQVYNNYKISWTNKVNTTFL